MSNFGGSPLCVSLENGLKQLGHSVEPYNSNHGYDLVIVWNQSAHITTYTYPAFPKQSRIAFIDSAEYGYFRRLPEVVKDYSFAFSPGSLSHDTKNRQEQERLLGYLQGKSFPYFLREFSKYITYPQNYHPIDYPMYCHSECSIPPNREEYLKRDLDLFVSWGGSHPWRLPLTQALRDCHTKCEINIIGENNWPRMPQDWFFGRTRAAKASVSFDGYGSSSFRLTEVLVRCLLLVGPLSIIRYAPLIDGVHCVEYQVESKGEQFLSTNICAKLREFLADPERSFRIYEAGYHHCWEYYSEKATAKYVLDVVAKHDWTRETSLTLG